MRKTICTASIFLLLVGVIVGTVYWLASLTEVQRGYLVNVVVGLCFAGILACSLVLIWGIAADFCAWLRREGK